MKIPSLFCATLFISLFLFKFEVLAQESLNTGGGEINGASGEVNYSIGQTYFTYYSAPIGSSLEGVQQPYRIIAVQPVTNDANLKFLIYPNPTTDRLTVEYDPIIHTELNYQLRNITGDLLMEGKLEKENTQINMRELIPSTYFLSIEDESNNTRLYKIIKN